MRAIFVVLLPCVVVASLLAGPAGAASTATAPSFTGTCTVSGTETFLPPLALAGRPGGARVRAAGRCSGTLIDTAGVAHSVRSAVASYQQLTSADSISCVGGVARGTGVLTIDGTALTFTVTEPQLTVISTLSYVAPAWKGSGLASVAPIANPLSLVFACLGAGIPDVPIVLTAQLRG